MQHFISFSFTENIKSWLFWGENVHFYNIVPNVSKNQNKILICKSKFNLHIFGWILCINIGKYVMSGNFLINKCMFILVIGESHVKMLGNDKFQKVVKLSKFCG